MDTLAPFRAGGQGFLMTLPESTQTGVSAIFWLALSRFSWHHQQTGDTLPLGRLFLSVLGLFLQ